MLAGVVDENLGAGIERVLIDTQVHGAEVAQHAATVPNEYPLVEGFQKLPPLTSLEIVRSLPNLPDVTESEITAAVAAASSAFRSQTGQTISLVEDDVVVLDGDGSWCLLLPQTPVRAVPCVEVEGQKLHYRQDYEWSKAGILRRIGRWPWSYRAVTVIYTHGYAPIPEDVAYAVAEDAGLRLAVPLGLDQSADGPFQSRYVKPGTTQTWVDTVARYRLRVQQ